MKRVQTTSLLLLVALGASCASGNLYSKNRETLNLALSSLESGDYRRCTTESNALAASTSGQAAKYRLQRFFAAYLMVQANMRAAFTGQGTFYNEPGRSGGMTLGSGAASGEFSVPHAVVASRMIGHGYDWSPTSGSAGPDQLPEALAQLGVTSAKLNMDLCRLAVLARLGFVLAANNVIEAARELQDLQACETLMERAQLPNEVRPWVTWASFQYLAEERPLDAYRFAVRTLYPMGGVSGIHQDELRDWITDGSEYVFQCNTCDQPANPTADSCFNINCSDPRPLIDFQAVPRN